MLAHQTVVARDPGLALRTVRDDIIDLLRILRHHLDVGREARTAETDDTRILDLCDDFLRCEAGIVDELSHTRGGRELSVIFNDDAVAGNARGIQSAIDRLHLAGAGTVNVCGNKTVRLRDQLARKHHVVLLYDRRGRLTDVLA